MKWLESLNANKPHIWSSVTLYDPAAIRKREEWFHAWLSESAYPGSLDIIHFHQKGGDGDPFNDIMMNRDHKLFTNSISSIRLSPETASFRYLDLRSGEDYGIHSCLSKNGSGKSMNGIPGWKKKPFWIRLFHWEYWSFNTVYIPIYPVFIFLCLRARSFFFYAASNPKIKNGGFLGESKKDIYALVPAAMATQNYFFSCRFQSGFCS